MQGYLPAGLAGAQTAFRLDIDPQDDKHLYRAGIVSTPEGKRHGEDADLHRDPAERRAAETTTIHTITEETELLRDRPLRLQGRRWTHASTPASSRAPAARRSSIRCRCSTAGSCSPSRPSTSTVRTTERRTFACSAATSSHPNLYLVGGYDDPLERSRSFFLGGGIRWNDDNIKSLLGLAGGLR